MECRGGLRAPRVYIYIYIRFALACVFSLQVYRGGGVASYVFKWFFALRGLVLALGLVSFAWAVVRGFEASFFPYINIFCELPIARPRRPYVNLNIDATIDVESDVLVGHSFYCCV